MKNIAALASFFLVVTACGAERPDECEITTTAGKVTCELEDNGRYACICGNDETFVDETFCEAGAGTQDFVAENNCRFDEGQ